MEAKDRIVLGAFVASVVVTLAVVGIVIADSRDTGGSASSPARGVSACEAALSRGVLPRWARTGFSDPRPRMAHVVGREGRLAAILFGDPLIAPPRPDRSNKILWVARKTPEPGPMRLLARDGRRVVRRVVESGPGPSIVDLPAGCWTVSATWNGGEDVLELSYAAG